MKWIKSIYDIENGDILFKNTELDDKGKNIFMRLINEITTGVSNIRRWFKGQPRIKGRDHTEFFLWSGTVLEVHSSVKGSGVRSMNFIKWMEREGYPQIEILRRPERMSVEEATVAQLQIVIDRGIPYALIPALREAISDGNEDLHLSTGDLMLRGIFCSESTKRYAGYKCWTGEWPDELWDTLVSDGYVCLYRDESGGLLR